MKTGREIIQEALEIAYATEPKSFIDKLFHRSPSMEKIQSSVIMHLTDKFIAERHRADEAEQKMYEAIRECLRFIEQVEPKEAQRLWMKYLNPSN